MQASLNFWLIQAQENPSESRQIVGRKLWRTNTLKNELAIVAIMLMLLLLHSVIIRRVCW